MPARIGTGRQGTESPNRADCAIATAWLVFYVLALGIAITSPLASGAIEFAAR
jgi:hypothetical protein